MINAISSRMRDWLGDSLKLYQKVGVYWMNARRSCLLADEQGLGKTVQAICTIPSGARALVVCPAIAKQVWRDHIDRLRPDLKPVIAKGLDYVYDFTEPGTVIIANFRIIPASLTRLVGRPDMIVGDEVHYLKNLDSDRTMNAYNVCLDHSRRGGRIVFATGTPIKNTPDDLWSILTLLGQAAPTFGDRKNYMDLMGGYRAARGVNWDRKRSKDIPQIMRKVMLRREKDDVLKELPPRHYKTITVAVPGPDRELCDEALKALSDRGISLEEAIETAASNNKSIEFTMMSSVCKALANAKIKALINLVDELDPNSDSPLLVWSRHVDPIEIVGARPGWEVLHGSTSKKKRASIQHRFQRGELKGLALSIKSGGTALTLTRSNHSIFCDEEWSPADNEQAEARNHRLGQTKPVTYTRLVADHILDRRMAEIQFEKRAIVKHVIRDSSIRYES